MKTASEDVTVWRLINTFLGLGKGECSVSQHYGSDSRHTIPWGGSFVGLRHDLGKERELRQNDVEKALAQGWAEIMQSMLNHGKSVLELQYSAEYKDAPWQNLLRMIKMSMLIKKGPTLLEYHVDICHRIWLQSQTRISGMDSFDNELISERKAWNYSVFSNSVIISNHIVHAVVDDICHASISLRMGFWGYRLDDFLAELLGSPWMIWYIQYGICTVFVK